MSSERRKASNLFEYQGVDLELFFATEILRLKSLHYGYWDTPPSRQRLNLRQLRAAQARYTRRLLATIPRNVKTVLDVGAGIGDNSRALDRAGYTVTALSPDKNHARYFHDLRRCGVQFHQSRFEDFHTNAQYDLVLLSESLNYIDMVVGLQQCQRYVRPGGYLLVAAMFRHPEERGYDATFHPMQLGYVQQALAHGFSLHEFRDITANVAPTMELAYGPVRKYINPIVSLLRWTLGLVVPRPFAKITQVQHYYMKRLNPQYFQRSIRYMILLFARDAENPIKAESA